MKRFSLLIGAATLALTIPSTVLAQEVIMRRPLPVPTDGAEWRTSPFIIYDRFGNVVQPQNACGPYEQRRDVDCIQRGEVVGDYYCRDAGPKPEETKNEFLDAGCSYTWYQGGFEDPGPSCSNAERQEQLVECRRDYDGEVVSDSLCSGTKPDTERTVVDHSTCTYSWNDEDPFADPGENCTATEEWTKNVFCERDLDKEPVAASMCDASSRPADTETRADYSTCTYSWDNDEYVDPGASCTATETQTRAVWCKRDLDDNVEPDSSCDPTQRPALSQVVEDYSDCTYEWREGGFDNPGGASCNASETQTQTVTCQRSNGDTVEDSFCTETKPDTQRVVEDFDSCTYAWDPGAWSNPGGASCTSAEDQTRTVVCRRSNGQIADDSFCTGTKPPSTRTVPDYDSCTYAWHQGGWNNPGGASCTSSETQTQTVTCRRSNGETVADSFCTGTKPPSSRNVPDYDSCTYEWDEGAWSNPGGASCTTSETRTRSVVCRRSNNEVVADSFCSGNKPATSQPFEDLDGCTYEWREGGFGPWTSTCSNSATRSQSVTCRRSDGTIMTGSQESLCTTNDGPKPAAQEGPIGLYSTCGYTPSYGAWSACNGTSRSRTMATCRRDTGDNVALSYCTDRGHDLTETESCVTYSWQQSGWENWNSTCSANATRDAIYVCKSSAGNTTVADSFCSGNKPTNSESSPIYSGCGYSAANWTNPANPTCSAANSETQTADCRRGDGTIVGDSECTSRSVSLTRTVNNGADYSGCGYTAVNWSGWTYASTCSTNTTRTRTAECRRDDGTIVSGTNCTSRGVSLTQTQTGQTNTTGCGYSWRYGAWQDPGASCTPAERQTRTETCRRDDGTNVNVSFCSGVSGRQSVTRDVEDFSGCNPGQNLEVDWGNYGPWSSTCSTSATRSRTGTCEANGVAVAASVCTSRGLAVSESQTSPQYSTCSYTPTYGSFGNCSNGSKSASMTACTRIVPQGNQSVSISECTSRGHVNPKTQACTQTVLFSGNWGDRNGYSCYTGWQNGTRENVTGYSPVESMNPAFGSCAAQGGTYIEMTRVGQCRWVSDNYRQDYDSGGTYRCIREQ